jgi:hypothetical protein
MNAPPAAQTAGVSGTVFGPIPDSTTIVLRPSFIEQFSNCSIQAAYDRAGVKPDYDPSPFVFGEVVHWVISVFLIRLVRGDEMVMLFRHRWNRAAQERAIRYSSIETHESLMNTGVRLMELFPQWYAQSGLRPLRMPNGDYAVEIRLNVELEPRVILSCQPDAFMEVTKIQLDSCGFVMARPGDIVVIDWKSPRTASSIAFAQRSTQPTYYKIAGEAHRAALGIDRVTSVGYVELLKKKVGSRGRGPEIIHPFLYPRSDQLVAEALERALYVAWRLRHGIYHRDSRMAWNTPCSECSYSGACLDGNTDDLVLPTGITADMLIKR